MLLLELVLVAVAQIDDRLHVDFVERGQDGRRRLRLHQPFGDARAQARHRHALLGPVAEGPEVHCRRRRVSRHGCHRGSRRFRRRLAAFQCADDIALGDPAAAAGAADGGGVEIPFGGQFLRRGHRRRGCRFRRSPGAAAGWAVDLRRQIAPPAASVSICAMTSLLATVLPSPLTIFTSTPDSGAGVSSTTLSVSMSTRFSSRLTYSPAFLCQVSSVASATDSESCGTFTSISIGHSVSERICSIFLPGRQRPRLQPGLAPLAVAGQRERLVDQFFLLLVVQRLVAGCRRGGRIAARIDTVSDAAADGATDSAGCGATSPGCGVLPGTTRSRSPSCSARSGRGNRHARTDRAGRCAPAARLSVRARAVPPCRS